MRQSAFLFSIFATALFAADKGAGTKTAPATAETAAPAPVAQRTSGWIGKITPASIKAQPAMVKTLETGDYLCATIFGIATGTKNKTMPNGDAFEAIAGEFEAVNETTGEVFKSGLVYLPSGIHEVVSEPLKAAPEDAMIEFGIQLFSVKASNPAGYSWKAVPFTRPSQADPLAHLRNAIPASSKLRLPAPVDQVQIAAPAAA